MSTHVMSPVASRPTAGSGSGSAAAAVILAAWFALVLGLAVVGAFVSPPGTAPLPIAIGFAAPIVIFLVGVLLWRPLREFVLATDVRLLVAIQGWRFAGLGFIALYVHGVLPGTFAWPAGLGDMAIAITAPWVLTAIARRPEFANSRAFVVWNLLGMLDLVVAVGTGALSSALASGLPGEITTRPMATLPLVLIPAYLVPIFMMLHVAALLQVRRSPPGK